MSKQFEQYVKSAIPEPYTIMGITLRPLSLGHLILMKRYGCPWAEETEKTSVSVFDLIFAIAICSRKYQEFIDWFNDAEVRDKWIKKWFKSIKKECHTNKNWSLLHKLSLFNMYRKESINVPLYFNESDESNVKESGAHWVQTLISILITEGRYTDTEIYDIPLSKALADYFKILEDKGSITLMADWQIEQINEQKKVCQTEK